MFKSILAIILALFISNSYAQTADEIINKYVTAIGGMEKINSINSAKITGKFSAGSMDITFTRLYKKPLKMSNAILFKSHAIIQIMMQLISELCNCIQE